MLLHQSTPRLTPKPRASRAIQLFWGPVDAAFDKLYGSRWNPIHYSGALAVFFFLALLVSGLYLFLFYSVGKPYDSVAELQSQVWAGRWVRSLHRYASDGVVVAVLVHVFKMMAAGKTWGPRALAWVSGVVLTGLMLFTGWTGMVMVWDMQGFVVAFEGARLLDLLPIFSQPISRSFIQQEAMPTSFFFMNLFLHVALPLGVGLVLWLHTSRVARPRLVPERAAMLVAGGVLLLTAMAWPVPMLPRAELLSIPGRFEMDMLFGFWVPVSRAVSPLSHFMLWAGGVGFLVLVPLWWKSPGGRPMPSVVDSNRCTGCTQCYEDCPYDAIQMVLRKEPSKLSEMVAEVNPSACVSCGICSASCAPMGVGPPLADGRNQLRAVEAFAASRKLRGDQVVVLGCSYGHTGLAQSDTIVPYPTGCSGAVHTSVIESLLRSGAGGVYVLTCPPASCSFREGPKWLEQRVYHDREAELKARVDKTRVAIGSFSAAEKGAAIQALRAFQQAIAARKLGGEAGPDLAEEECSNEEKHA